MDLAYPILNNCITMILWFIIFLQNLLDNLPHHDTLASIARLIMLFQMITVYPLLAYIFRVNAMYAVFNTAWPG